MIPVTKPFLPSLSEYQKYIEGIWDRQWLTNNGECVQALEKQLKHYLKVPNLLFCNNGTIVLQFAIRVLELKGEIITTPFSYVATTSAILWENCTPVFVDIEPDTLTINSDLIEQQINERTCAILATHVYGSPCNIENIERIAKKYNLKIIYDAAHCFGVEYKGKNICSYGDISTLSFHATKLFHSVEGGAIITQDADLCKKIELMRQFGHIGDDHYSLGINGKASEFHAAMGLCVLPQVNEIMAERKRISEWYDSMLNFNVLQKPQIRPQTNYNYAYYPVILKSEKQLLQVVDMLQRQNIGARRYFYPSLNKLSYLKERYFCPVSEDISVRILSLPLYIGLKEQDIKKISTIINENIL
jgi:dTDP-4-amino-4,6-dideoxygalactose transaminase